MTDLMQTIERYGQAMADVHDGSKSYGVRTESMKLAGTLHDLIRVRVQNLEANQRP